ncbi:hypothetical protein BX600DRAFT_518918 [Xylariales sp. PMI_506]|nr:hypothetical protein BX600DRAFT_518918 [Xylariales sp. PMI_506]
MMVNNIIVIAIYAIITAAALSAHEPLITSAPSLADRQDGQLGLDMSSATAGIAIHDAKARSSLAGFDPDDVAAADAFSLAEGAASSSLASASPAEATVLVLAATAVHASLETAQHATSSVRASHSAREAKVMTTASPTIHISVWGNEKWEQLGLLLGAAGCAVFAMLAGSRDTAMSALHEKLNSGAFFSLG